MEIKNIIIHEVSKNDNSTMQSKFRNQPNAINEHAINLSQKLSGLFNKSGLSSGSFAKGINPNDPKPFFEQLLSTNFTDNSFPSFVEFTQSASRHFEDKLRSTPAAKGGYLWFNHYTHNNENFLSIVLLRNKDGLQLSTDLSLDTIKELDLDTLHMAARINLTKWQSGESNKFISFKIGQKVKDVTDYFSNFIGCEEFTQAKFDTKNLNNAILEYCRFHNFNRETTEEARQIVQKHCIQLLFEEKPASIIRLSNLLDSHYNPEIGNKYLEICQSEPYNLTNEFALDRSTVKGFSRIRGSSLKLSISFESELLNKSVFFDRSNKSLTINELPEDLILQLEELPE